MNEFYFSGTSEFESMRKNYTKFVDAYGCLGVLRINAGKKSFVKLLEKKNSFEGLKFFLKK